jgi:hypothetical protein
MAMTLDGSNGVTFNDASIQASAAAPFTLKNRIINGDMSIDQRNNGSSLSISSGSLVYTVDRFMVLPLSSGCTAQRVSGISGFQNALRVTGAAGNSQIQIHQKIESANTFDLINQTVTISFYAQASSSKTPTLFFVYPNAVDNWSGYTDIASSAFNVTTSPQRFSFTFNAGANAGNGLGIIIANAGFGAGETLTITGVQLERGSIATQFEWLPISTELALCQRYYEQTVLGNMQIPNGTGSAMINPISFHVTKRVSPTMATITAATLNGAGSTGLNGVSVDGFGLQFVNSSGTNNFFTNSPVYSASAEL